MTRTRTYKKCGQEAFAALLLKIKADQAAVQARFTAGLNVSEFAREHGVAETTAATLLDAVGIERRRRTRTTQGEDLRTSAMLTVLARICKELNVSAPELEAFAK